MSVDTGGAVLIVVTAWAVEVGNLVAVATVGSFCGDVEVRKSNVSGVETDGKLLDEATLGWPGGAANCTCILPASCQIGTTAPESRPKRVVAEATDEQIAEAAAKKAAAEEKAAKAKAKKDEKAVAKEGKKTKASKEAEGSEEEKELVKASKAQLATIRKQLVSLSPPLSPSLSLFLSSLLLSLSSLSLSLARSFSLSCSFSPALSLSHTLTPSLSLLLALSLFLSLSFFLSLSLLLSLSLIFVSVLPFRIPLDLCVLVQAAKRKAGEEITTDDELEAAGFMSL